MSKKITSVLVLLTALLLTLPSQAQIQNQAFTPVKKKAVTEMQGQRKTLKVKPADATVQANAAPARTAEEKKLSFLEEQYLIDKAAKEAETPAPAWNWAKQTAPKFVTKSDLIKPLNFRGNLASTHKVKPFVGNDITSAASNRAATTNAYGIITAPDEGESKFYTRAGTAYYASSNQVYSAAQSGTVEIVEAADGTVYIKDIVSRYSQGTWVKGTKEGNTITVAAGQPVQYNANYSTTLGVYWGNYDESTDNGWNKQAGDITFTVDEAAGTISLVGSNEDLYIGIFWDDDDAFAGYGDYETVWTLDEGYVPPSEELVELPAGATVETWYREQTNATSTGSTAVTGDAKVAIVDNEVYISGMFTQFPDAWIKGTIEGTTVTFAGGQFIGYYGGTTPIWAFGTDGNALTDFTATYDAAAKSLVADNDLLANGAADRIYYLQWIEGLSLYAEQPAPAQIDELPYSNDFSDATLTKHFTVIDANGDGTTWGASSGSFAISHADANDDWLVSPAIKLVAGKKYHVAFDSWARSAGYPETFEVKAATEASAEALAAGTTVIASQAISNSAAQTFENNEFTVAETGYYYIGIHNTSYDAWAQYVDNFLIEAAPITAPYSADLTQAGAIDDFSVIDNNGDGTTWAWTATNGIYYSYNSNNAADDYLILPIKLEAGKNYNVVVTAAAAASSYPEKFEVVAGKTGTVAGLTTTVIPETTVDVTANTEYAGTLTTDEAGTYYVAIHATSAADMYQLRLKKLVIEVGAEGTAPAAVTDFAVAQVPDELKVNVSFTAPTKSIAGEDLTENIAKIEVLRNGEVVKTLENVAPGSAQSFVDEVPAVGAYTYQAIPYDAEGIGEKSEELSVTVATSLNVPYTFDLTQNLLDLFTVINNNDDSSTWTWSASYGTSYSYNSTNQADDYLISAPFNLVAGKSYLVTVAARAYSASNSERFEVKVGKAATVAGLTQTVITNTDVTSTEATDYEGEFSVAEDGQYFIAIHATSDPDKWRLIVEKLSVEAGAEPTAPAAVSDLAVTAGAEGALQATLTFTAPATAVNGSALSGTEDVKIYRDDALVNTLTAVAPGSAQTWTDTEVTTGTVTYYVVAANESGDGQKSQKVSVYVGEDQLADVENVVAVATPSSIAFSWNEATGLNGGYVDLANVEYNVWSLAIEAGYFGNYLVEDQILKTVTGETTATIDYDTMTGEQEYKYFGVSAANAAGETDPVTNYAYVLVGAPDELPIEENFTGNSLHYNWDTNGGLGVDTDTSDGDGSALKLYNNGNSADVFFVLPKVNLNPAGNPTLMFDVKAGVGVDKVIAYGAVAGGEAVDLAEFNVTDEYTTVKAPLNSIKGGAYASVGIRANIPTASLQQYEDYVLIDNIKIVDLLEYNLNINVTAPSNVNVGETATVKATVRNVGEFAASGYTVIIKAGDKELLNETVNEELASFATKELTAELETSIFDEATSVEITASVVYANDLDEDDNEASAVVTLKASAAAGPSNVAAEEDAENPGNINVTWNAPDNATQAVVEDFASYENGADETGELGDWTLINANGHTKGGIFEDVTLASDGQVRAWQVFNLATYGGDNSAFAGPDGDVDNNYLISTYNLEDSAYPGNDDWLISPSLPGVAQSVSFDVKAFNDYGPQTYQVLYSTTDNQPESFTLIEEVEDNGNAWNNVSYNLPEGTTYFAIRNVTGGDSGFILAVDNITFTVGGGEVDHYNIYLDEEQVAQVGVDGEEITVNAEALHRAAAALSYTIAGVEPGEHKVAVTVVYTNGQESSPVAAGTNTVVTGIVKLLIEGQPVDIYTIDGKLVRQQTTNLNGLSGAYIINGKKVILK